MTSPADLAHRIRTRAGAAADAVPRPVRQLAGWVRSQEFFTTSASLAFYAMISIPPMVLIALWVADVVLPDAVLQDLGSDVDEQSPDALPVGDVLRGLIDAATTAGWVAVLAALWPATAYGAALARAFSDIAPEAERRIHGWKGRLLALVLVALLPLLVFAALAVLYLGPRVVDVSGTALRAAVGAGAVLAFALIVAVVFVLFEVRDTSPGDVVYGAAIAAGLQVVVTGGYLLYLQTVADFEDTYGSTSLAVAVLLGFWLLLSNASLIAAYRLMLRRCRRRTGRPSTG